MITYKECVGLTVYDILMIIKERYGDRPSFCSMIAGREKVIAYDTFVDHILKTAYLFERDNLFGKRIVISGSNAYEHVVSMLAGITMGATVAMLNFDLDTEELYLDMKRLSPDLVICTGEDAEILPRTINGHTYRLTLSDSDEYEYSIDHILKTIEFKYTPKDKMDLETISLLLKTSGSTGSGKWVMIPQRAFWPHDTTPTGKQTLVLPLYHVAVISAIWDNICQGVPLCLSDMVKGIDDITWFKPRLLLSVPIFLKMVVKKALKGDLDLSCFEMIGSGGAKEDREVTAFLMEMGIFSPSLYGATETMGSVSYSDKDTYKAGSVGLIGSWNEVKISKNEEILIKGSCIMSGYLNDPEGTKKALKDGWYHTGDIGYIDEDGFLFITGRLKNTIILSNGENVSPEVIENSLSACDVIEESVVKGENDMLVAYLLCKKAGDVAQEDKARDFIEQYNRRVPLYHRIRKIIFMDIPFKRTESGKVKR